MIMCFKKKQIPEVNIRIYLHYQLNLDAQDINLCVN